MAAAAASATRVLRPWEVGATWCLRLLLVLPVLGHISGVLDLDGPVDALWQAVQASGASQRPLLEAQVAANSFGFWIVLFSALDALPCLEGFRLAPFRADAAPAHVCLLVVIFVWALAILLGQSPAGGVLPPFCLAFLILGAWLVGSLRRLRDASFRGYVLRIGATFYVYLSAILGWHSVKSPRPADSGAATFGRTALEVVLGVVAYDFLFAFIHFGYHRGFGSKAHHQVHHRVQVFAGRVLPSDTVNHSLLDGTLQVLINIIVQNMDVFGPKHKLSRLIHNVVVTGLLVEAHAGYDTFWSSHRLLPGIIGGPLRHIAHHTHGRHYYQQFFCYLDDHVFSKCE